MYIRLYYSTEAKCLILKNLMATHYLIWFQNRLEMLNIEPFNRLIEEKWERFAKRMFMFNFIVYVIYLSIFTAVAYHREAGKDFNNIQVGIQPRAEVGTQNPVPVTFCCFTAGQHSVHLHLQRK